MKRLGISYSSLVSLLKKVFTLSIINWQSQKIQGSIRLGIDEHHFGKKNKYLITIANLLSGKPIHIIPNDTQASLVSFLKSLPVEVQEAIDEVCIDMKQTFLYGVKKVLPKAHIVIDHFHVIQDANRRLMKQER